MVRQLLEINSTVLKMKEKLNKLRQNVRSYYVSNQFVLKNTLRWQKLVVVLL